MTSYTKLVYKNNDSTKHVSTDGYGTQSLPQVTTIQRNLHSF